jgi:hypothetical protein
MVDIPTNFQSIVGGIFRGLSNDKRSVGLTGSNVKTDNPQTYTWIGQETSDLRQPIEKEQTQNPSLPFLKGSSGTQYAYTNPLPTDIRTGILESYPGTSIEKTFVPSSIGSLLQPMPDMVPLNNWQQRGYGMSPQNADHFKTYFANQIGLTNLIPQPTPSNTMDAVQAQQQSSTVGRHSDWFNVWQHILTMRKTYTPANNFRG